PSSAKIICANHEAPTPMNFIPPSEYLAGEEHACSAPAVWIEPGEYRGDGRLSRAQRKINETCRVRYGSAARHAIRLTVCGRQIFLIFQCDNWCRKRESNPRPHHYE